MPLFSSKTKQVSSMDAFLGSWKLESSEGLNELLSRLGAGYITRKTQNASKPVITFAREKGPGDPEVGELFSLKTITALKTSSSYFRIGYAFDENTFDGRTVRTVFTVDGNTLKQEQTGTKSTFITYTVDGDLLKSVIKVDDITCFRNYRRVGQTAPTTEAAKTTTNGETVSQPSSGKVATDSTHQTGDRTAAAAAADTSGKNVAKANNSSTTNSNTTTGTGEARRFRLSVSTLTGRRDTMKNNAVDNNEKTETTTTTTTTTVSH